MAGSPEQPKVSGEKLAQEEKKVSSLTKEDMRSIARITGGAFRDLSKHYSYERGTVIWPGPMEDDLVCLVLREEPHNQNLCLWIKGSGFNKFISGASAVVLNRKDRSVTIKEPGSGGEQECWSLNIKREEINCSIRHLPFLSKNQSKTKVKRDKS